MGHVNHSDSLNPILENMGVYASKAISLRAKTDPHVADLSFGEPAFGPPEHLLDAIRTQDLTLASFLASAKHYEESRGNPLLRKAIANWYESRYGLIVDPDTEILVTHGGVAAITLAILATTECNDTVLISDPSYMLYSRTVRALSRNVDFFPRPASGDEYAHLAQVTHRTGRNAVKAILINSPENPTGYMLSQADWDVCATVCDGASWIIHDEVYDVMAFDRTHHPARTIPGLQHHSLIVNSFSKKFGLPGLRIGWILGPRNVIDLAAKAHDYLYLGVNIQYEQIAVRLLSDKECFSWLERMASDIQKRALRVVTELTSASGYAWPRLPLGGMFAFPDVTQLYHHLPSSFKVPNVPVGDAVARYLFEERKVAVVPGSVYGSHSESHIRLVLCSKANHFEDAITRLRSDI